MDLITRAASYGQFFFQELFSSPLNLFLLAICAFLVYKIFHQSSGDGNDIPAPPPLPRIEKDMTLAELRQYDGTDEHKRILIAINNKIYDVTRRGQDFYGQGGPYSMFAGRDASRGLATFSLDDSSVKDDYDDLSDLSTEDMDRMKEWELQFSEKYQFVGKLLRPGETSFKLVDLDAEEERKLDEKKID